MERPPTRLTRRSFVRNGCAGAACLLAGKTWARGADGTAVRLSAEHDKAVNRRRRIVVQYDAWSQLGIDFRKWLDYRFAYVDEPGSQIDSLWWDIGALGYATYPSKVLKPQLHAGLQKWRDQGIDWVARLVEETRRRGLEVFWSHRISEVELTPEGTGADWKGGVHPIKKAHPDWVIKNTWWKQGLWNLAVPAVRQYKVRVLRELAESYDFDGFQLDFARHVPCLPPPRQWELRGHVTELLRMVRVMLLDVARRRRRPLLLAARVPSNLEACRADGFDVEAWARENLVDILSLGTRSMDVDLAGFRRVVQGRNIKLQPCLDDHHATDGYRYPPIEFFRGVFGNWWQQGADSVMTFNWSNAPPELCKEVGAPAGPLSHRQAYQEIGSPATLRGKDKVFAVQRRGGYPWAGGAFNRNQTAPLPALLPVDGKAIDLTIRICDDLKRPARPVKRVTLRAVLFGAGVADDIEMRLNGTALAPPARDPAWKDPQIFSPKPQPASGGNGRYRVNPQQKLLRLDYRVAPALCRVGANRAQVRLNPATSGGGERKIALEKLEVHMEYA